MTPPPPSPDVSKGLALSLESSFLGFFAHAGFTAAVLGKGIRPQFLTGASSGSLIASLAAAGFSSGEIREVIFPSKFKWSFFEWPGIARGIGMMLWLRGACGLSSGKKVRRYLEGVFARRVTRIEDCPAGQLSIAVANLSKLSTEILTDGEIAAAVVASFSVPILMSPQKLPSGYCWDGGVANSCPFDHFADDPAVHTVITHHIEGNSVGSDWSSLAFRPRISDAFGRGHQLITNEMHGLRVRRLEDAGKRLIAVTTSCPRPGLFSRRKTLDQCYQAGYDSGSAFADKFLAGS